VNQPRPSPPPLSRSTRLWYASGQLAEGIKNESFATFLLFYYNQVLGLSGSLAGLAILIALLFDAVTDPLIGVLSDRTKSRYGRRLPYLFASALPLGVTFIAAFQPPAGLDEGGLFWWLLVFTVLCRGSMTLFHVPYLSLGAELSDDYEERTLLVTLRMLFARFAGIFPGFALLVLMRPSDAYPDGRFDPTAYPVYAWLCGTTMVVVVLASAWNTRSRVPYLPAPSVAPHGVLRSIVTDGWEALQLRSFRALFIGSAFTFTAWGVSVTLGLHTATYFWAASTNQMVIWGVANAFGVVAGLGFWTRRAAATDKKPVFMHGMYGYTAFLVVPYLLAVEGLWPERGSAASIALWAILTGTIAHFFLASTMVTGQSMMADVAEEDALRSGRRREGVFFGASSFVTKLVFGLGAQIAGVIVDLVGLVPGTDPAEVSPDVVRDLGLASAVALGLLVTLSLLFFSRYDLDRKRSRGIQEALREREASQGRT
jgi:GPH family glycoside/pentoside/hexuronide:cation symporter